MSNIQGDEGSDSLGADPGTVIDMAGGRFELLLETGSGEEGRAIFRTRMAGGRRVPLHSHDDPEFLYVLSGSLDVFRQGAEPEWTTIPEGAGIMISDGVAHALRNSADVPADLIVVTNQRLASFFRDAGRLVGRNDPVVPPSPDDLRRMRDASEAYGYTMYDPQQSLEITG